MHLCCFGIGKELNGFGTQKLDYNEMYINFFHEIWVYCEKSLVSKPMALVSLKLIQLNAEFEEICFCYSLMTIDLITKNVHFPRQYSCHGMCQISLWSDRCGRRYQHMYLNQIWSLIEIFLVEQAPGQHHHHLQKIMLRVYHAMKMTEVLYSLTEVMVTWLMKISGILSWMRIYIYRYSHSVVSTSMVPCRNFIYSLCISCEWPI